MLTTSNFGSQCIKVTTGVVVTSGDGVAVALPSQIVFQAY